MRASMVATMRVTGYSHSFFNCFSVIFNPNHLIITPLIGQTKSFSNRILISFISSRLNTFLPITPQNNLFRRGYKNRDKKK